MRALINISLLPKDAKGIFLLHSNHLHTNNQILSYFDDLRQQQQQQQQSGRSPKKQIIAQRALY